LCDLAGIAVIRDDPIVSYRETIIEKSKQTCLGKSPNKHNRLFLTSEPVKEECILEVEKENIFAGQDMKKRARILIDEHEWEDDHARKIWSFGPNGTGPNFFVDGSKGIQ